MPKRPIAWLAGSVALVLFYGLGPLTVHDPYLRIVLGDVVPFIVGMGTLILSARNAIDSRGHTRLFWGLMTAGIAMWWFNQGGWVWYEVVLRRQLPDPFEGDIVLFLHFVPLMAAAAIRPQHKDSNDGMLPSALNVIILLVWWVVVYAFLVFPEEYLITKVPVYTLRWDILYLAEALILIAVSGWSFLTSSGSWRTVYCSLLIATVLYAFASENINAAIARGTYTTGGIYDVPFLIALLGYFWVALIGRRCLSETQAVSAVPPHVGRLASLLAKLALVSLPVMGYWALHISTAEPSLRQVRFAVAMGGVAILAFFVFLKQHLLDQRLVHLLKQSRSGYDNLQRLQGRVVQQAKLASLGELVALAASELEYPLSAILENSERLSSSGNLSREQLATAQKIGQQARRTGDLVNDLLSFAQQTPGEKVPLELKPLLQRAMQMEGFKLRNREIQLSLQCDETMPRVLGNSNQLLQAFLQIIENAVDALQEVGRGQLTLSIRPESNELVIEFADTGPGLREPERVFDPFYTTKPIGKGTGLGLSATYGVIQDHKGQITCHNRPEGGASFEVRLPVIRVGAQVARA